MMFQYTRSLIIGGVALLLGIVIMASIQGWGIPDLRNRTLLLENSKDCPGYLKDEYGNCRNSDYRRTIGRRVFFGDGSSYGK